MLETTFEIQVPTPLLQFGFDKNKIQSRITEWMVLSLFTEGVFSSGKAAEFLKISRVEFLTLLKKRGIAFIDYTPAELEEEWTAVELLEVKIAK